MRSQDFSAKNFGRLTKSGDYWLYFKETESRTSKSVKEEVLAKIQSQLHIELYSFQELRCFKVNDKYVYSLPKILDDNSNRLSVISDDFILRKINYNIKRIYRLKQADRFQIVSSVQHLLANPAPFYVCKLDIESFYESIDRQKILKEIENSAIVSYQTKKLLKVFFDGLKSETGLPRGINISATLSEYFLRKFDKKVSNDETIYYYARFVDDIIIFSTEEITEAKITEMSNILPEGLNFNMNKKEVYDFSTDKIDSDESNSITYLGYEFNCSKENNQRKISTRIAEKKINKIKTRLVLAFLDYKHNKDFGLLKDRVLFLTATYPLKTSKEKISKYESGGSLHGGLLYSYPLIDDLSCLSELDTLLNILLFSRNLQAKFNNNLTDEQRKRIKKISFKGGYERRIFRKFKRDRISLITRCWR